MNDYIACSAILAAVYAVIILAWWIAAAGWDPGIIVFSVVGIVYIVRDALVGEVPA